MILSTLHVRNSISVFRRLADMGVNVSGFAEQIVGISSQRLLTLNCPHCRERIVSRLNSHLRKCDLERLEYGEDAYGQTGYITYRSKGCEKCNHNGYLGRVPLIEIITFDNYLRDYFAEQHGLIDIEKYLRKNLGFRSLWDKGMYNVFHQLYMLLTSGSTLQQSLKDIAPYQEKKRLKEALVNISKSLSTGISTGAAFRKESIFPMVVAPSLEAGDKAGELSKSLFQLSEMMYLQHNLYTKVAGALFVPKMSAILMTLMTVGYIKIAIPEFLQLYKDNNIEVPAVVSIVSGFVNMVVDNWYITIFVVYLLWKLWDWFSTRNVSLIDMWKLKLPIYKKLQKNL